MRTVGPATRCVPGGVRVLADTNNNDGYHAKRSTKYSHRSDMVFPTVHSDFRKN